MVTLGCPLARIETCYVAELVAELRAEGHLMSKLLRQNTGRLVVGVACSKWGCLNGGNGRFGLMP